MCLFRDSVYLVFVDSANQQGYNLLYVIYFGAVKMKRILAYLKPYRLRMLVGFMIKVTGTMAELVLPYILTHILENVITGNSVRKVVA